MWDEFQRQHVLDPAGEGSTYSQWSRAQWNDWYRARVPGKYGNKQINSVIISSPDAILTDFTQHSYGVNKYHQNVLTFYWTHQ